MDEVIAAIQGANRFQELSARCYRHFEKMGVCHFSYFHFPPIGAVDYSSIKLIVWLGYPKAWENAYIEAGYVEKDPVIFELLSKNHPVWTKEVLSRADASAEERSYLELLNECGVQDGLAVPVYGPDGRDGGYGIGFQDNAPEVSTSVINEIHWICQVAHIKYCELLDRKLDKPPVLSGREADVLRLIAHGNTNKQIALALDISSKTIETYLSRTFNKLDVNDRMTAALRAISLGII